jgi:hypothetical protein
MQAINHTVFGTLVALTINEPVIALPIALASHFVMDYIPHYGEDPKAARGSTAYNLRVVIDILASILLLLFFLNFHPLHPGLIIACAIAATLPDFLWPIALYIKHRGPLWAFFKFHKLLQHESRAGIFVEIVWLAVTTTIVLLKLH